MTATSALGKSMDMVTASQLCVRGYRRRFLVERVHVLELEYDAPSSQTTASYIVQLGFFDSLSKSDPLTNQELRGAVAGLRGQCAKIVSSN